MCLYIPLYSNKPAIHVFKISLLPGLVPSPRHHGFLSNHTNMPGTPYKLSATLESHVQDVKCVASTSGGSGSHLPAVLSSSRDRSAKIWRSSTSSSEWSCASTLEGHEGYVNAVCSVRLADGTEYAATGGQDSTIALWDCSSGEMRKVLVGHTSNVCALDADSSNTGILASASWDK